MGPERLVTPALEDKLRVLAEAWGHCHLELLVLHDGALSLTKHLLALEGDILDCTVIEFEELTLKRYNDVVLPILRIDSVEIRCMRRVRSLTLDEWIGRAKEALKNLEVLTSVSVASKFVLALGNTILETILTVLVVNSLHERVT